MGTTKWSLSPTGADDTTSSCLFSNYLGKGFVQDFDTAICDKAIALCATMEGGTSGAAFAFRVPSSHGLDASSTKGDTWNRGKQIPLPKGHGASGLHQKSEDDLYHPTCEDDIICLVKKAYAERLQIRVRGAAHSVAWWIYTDPGPAAKSKEEPRVWRMSTQFRPSHGTSCKRLPEGVLHD